MNRAQGLIEVVGLTNAIIEADTMLKDSNIKMYNDEIRKSTIMVGKGKLIKMKC